LILTGCRYECYVLFCGPRVMNSDFYGPPLDFLELLNIYFILKFISLTWVFLDVLNYHPLNRCFKVESYFILGFFNVVRQRETVINFELETSNFKTQYDICTQKYTCFFVLYNLLHFLYTFSNSNFNYIKKANIFVLSCSQNNDLENIFGCDICGYRAIRWF